MKRKTEKYHTPRSAPLLSDNRILYLHPAGGLGRSHLTGESLEQPRQSLCSWLSGGGDARKHVIIIDAMGDECRHSQHLLVRVVDLRVDTNITRLESRREKKRRRRRKDTAKSSMQSAFHSPFRTKLQ